MKISELKDKQGNVNIDVKVIYDKMQEKEYKGRRWKTLVVADIDSEHGDDTALLDVCDEDISKFAFQDKLRVINGYAKKIKTHRNGVETEQSLITYGFSSGKLLGKYEKIELIEDK